MPRSETPTGWRWCALSKIARLETGHTPSRKHPEYWGGSTPWIGIRDATGHHGETIFSTQQYTNDLGIANSSARVLPANTVCLSRTASVGYVVVMGVPMATSQDFVNWVCSDALDHRFLKYILLAEHDSMLRFASGTTHQTIYFPEAKGFHVCIPDVIEQRKIADVLQALDDRISVLRETNATLEAIAQALFKSWFVDFDPVRAKAEGREPEGVNAEVAGLFPESLNESELGPIPEGWLRTTLGQVCALHGGAIQTGPFGSQLHASDYVVAGIPVVMPKDLANRRINELSIARIPQSEADRLARHKVQSGDIVFSRRGDVERHALIGKLESGWICGTGCLLVRPGPAWPSSTFLSIALDDQRARKWLVRHAVGATMPNLNTGILSSVPLVVPPTEILDAFENIVASTEEKRSMNYKTIQVLTELRDTLLPHLISGQLQLPEADALQQDAA
jgi:type I restriction enzyme S subunit